MRVFCFRVNRKLCFYSSSRLSGALVSFHSSLLSSLLPQVRNTQTATSTLLNYFCLVIHLSLAPSFRLPSFNSFGTRRQLTSPRMAVRKRSILALGHLVPCCSPALFSQLTEHLLTELNKAPPTSVTRTYIQCLATISRQGGHRVGETCSCM